MNKVDSRTQDMIAYCLGLIRVCLNPDYIQGVIDGFYRADLINSEIHTELDILLRKSTGRDNATKKV